MATVTPHDIQISMGANVSRLRFVLREGRRASVAVRGPTTDAGCGSHCLAHFVLLLGTCESREATSEEVFG